MPEYTYNYTIIIGMKLNVSDIFKNPTEVKAYFVDRKIIPSEVVDAIMESQINITRVSKFSSECDMLFINTRVSIGLRPDRFCGLQRNSMRSGSTGRVLGNS